MCASQGQVRPVASPVCRMQQHGMLGLINKLLHGAAQLSCGSHAGRGVAAAAAAAAYTLTTGVYVLTTGDCGHVKMAGVVLLV
jgi:hypothetical protein